MSAFVSNLLSVCHVLRITVYCSFDGQVYHTQKNCLKHQSQITGQYAPVRGLSITAARGHSSQTLHSVYVVFLSLRT